MSRLEIRLLGGFEAKLTDRPVQRFESQKVRALLGYLSLKRERAIDRDHLSGMFWPDRPDEAARRNLRQALYSIRSSLGTDGGGSVLETEANGVRLHSDLDCWVDVEEFRERVREGLAAAGPDPLQLTAAVRLYKGDLLAGFFLRGCVAFEEWLVTTQEELREEALQTFRTLVKTYLSRGESRFGIQYAKRLLAIDPLSEEAHRQLMRLYSISGRRNRALAQYEHLLNLLQAELGVDPVPETTELYRSILLGGGEQEAGEAEEESTPPIVPLVGRAEHFESLQEVWRAVLDGSGRFTVVTGESGVGKSRLVKSFVDGLTSRRDAVVLRGRSYAAAPLIGFRPIGEAIRALFSDRLPDEPEVTEQLTPRLLADLARYCPELVQVAAGTLELTIDPSLAQEQRGGRPLVELLDCLTAPREGEERPVIVLLDDLQWADSATLEVVRDLAASLEGRSLWVLATARSTEILGDAFEAAGEAGSTLPVGRLTADQVGEIAKALVDLASAPVLGDYLWQSGQGLPLAIAELVNLLWDEKVLFQLSPGIWALKADPGSVMPPDDIGELIHRRFRKLPTSARRLLSLAAVLGHHFDVEILTSAADEHLNVVETAVELSLERWLIRQFPRSWSQAGPTRDLVLWARGARRGYFEFSHRAIRAAILDRINPLRKRIMHGEAARAILQHHAADLGAVCEELAFHLQEAGESEEALPWVELAAERAGTSGAVDVAATHAARAQAIAEQIAIRTQNSASGNRVVSIRPEPPSRPPSQE